MATSNISRINGFRPVRHSTGAPYNGQCNIYATSASDGTALFVGDPVTFNSAGANTAGIATVQKGAAGAKILGVVVGIIPSKMDPVGGTMTTGSTALDTPQYRAANSTNYVLVCDAPDVVYEVQQSTSGSAYTYAAGDVSLNADAYYGTAGSTVTGASGCTLDMNTKATTSTLQFKILGVAPRVDNSVISGTDQYVKVLCQINNATLAGGAGAAGN